MDTYKCASKPPKLPFPQQGRVGEGGSGVGGRAMAEEGSVLRATGGSDVTNFVERRCGRAVPGGGEQQMSGRDRTQMHDDGCNWGLKDERILALVCAAVNWDPHVLSVAACVSRRLRAVAKRVLWRELCFARAPRMVAALAGASGGGAASRMAMNGGWHALAKIFFFCCGSAPSRHFRAGRPSPGHFVGVSRFSKTSGRSFLARRCWGDLLYVSDPCEHPAGEGAGEAYDVGVYRGVFGGFMRSRTRACLIARQAELEARVRCPYCGARVWSMTAARLVPRTAARRLGSPHGGLEYFVCVNGHLHGNCWLAHLSSSSDDDDDDDDGGGSTSTGGEPAAPAGTMTTILMAPETTATSGIRTTSDTWRDVCRR